MTSSLSAGFQRTTITIVGIVATGVIVDSLAKAAARAWLLPYEPVLVLPGFRLTLGFNPGISFGLFPASSPLGFAIMVGLQTILTVGLGYYLYRTNNAVIRLCLAAIVAGALGNLFDRMVNGAVTDYLDFDIGQWHWPTFNLADIFITMGAIGIIAQEFLVARGHMSLGTKE